MGSFRIEGISGLQDKLTNLAQQRLSNNALKATLRKGASLTVKEARAELGKDGPMPEMDKTWASIGVKALRPKKGSIAFMVWTRKDLKYWGKLSGPGRAALTASGAYKNPDRDGRDGKRRGNIQKHAQGDFIEAGFARAKPVIESMISTWFNGKLAKSF